MSISKKRLTIRSIFWLLSIAIMLTIFCFSAQPGEVSKQISADIIETPIDSFVPEYHQMNEDRQKELVDSLQIYVRKGAHIGAYALLGFCIGCATLTHLWSHWARCAFSSLLSVAYAVSDEIHQHYVPNRSGNLDDVIIDTIGAAIGIFIALGIIALICRKHIRRQN